MQYAIVGYAATKLCELRSKGYRNRDRQSEGTRIRALCHLRRFGQRPSYSPHRRINQSAERKERKTCTRP